MKRTDMKIPFSILWAGLSVLGLSLFITPYHCQAFDASINISPNIINIDSIDHAFGIHTDVPYSIVKIDEVILMCPEDGVLTPIVCYADSRGNLVAKFETAELEAECTLDIGEYNYLELRGLTKDDPAQEFSGTGEVLIIEQQSEMRKGNGQQGSQNKYGRNR